MSGAGRRLFVSVTMAVVAVEPVFGARMFPVNPNDVNKKKQNCCKKFESDVCERGGRL